MLAGEQRGADGDGGVFPAAVGHVLPDQHAQPVAVVVPARGLNLDVLAQRVEAHRLGCGDVKGQGLVAGRGVQAVRPPALVEQAVHKIRLAVERKALHAVPVLADAHASQREVALDHVVAQRQLYRIEIGLLGRPGAHLAQLQQRGGSGVKVVAVAAYLCVYRALAAAGDFNCAVLQMRSDEERGDVVLRHALAPDGLPDAADRRVPYAAGLELLLASGVIARVRLVGDAHDKGVDAGLQQLGYVCREGQVSAGVDTGVHAVYPDAGALVHCAEVQQHAPDVEALGQLKVAPVPEVLAGHERAADAGQGALEREGDDYLAVILLRLGVNRTHGVFPDAVQIQIALAPELRSWVFGQRVLPVERLAPLCH